MGFVRGIGRTTKKGVRVVAETTNAGVDAHHTRSSLDRYETLVGKIRSINVAWHAGLFIGFVILSGLASGLALEFGWSVASFLLSTVAFVFGAMTFGLVRREPWAWGGKPELRSIITTAAVVVGTWTLSLVAAPVLITTSIAAIGPLLWAVAHFVPFSGGLVIWRMHGVAIADLNSIKRGLDGTSGIIYSLTKVPMADYEKLKAIRIDRRRRIVHLDLVRATASHLNFSDAEDFLSTTPYMVGPKSIAGKLLVLQPPNLETVHRRRLLASSHGMITRWDPASGVGELHERFTPSQLRQLQVHLVRQGHTITDVDVVLAPMRFRTRPTTERDLAILTEWVERLGKPDGSEFLFDIVPEWVANDDPDDLDTVPERLESITVWRSPFKALDAEKKASVWAHLINDSGVPKGSAGWTVEHHHTENKTVLRYGKKPKLPERVSLLEILHAATSWNLIPFAMGPDGHPIVTDLKKTPHCLWAGTTGSGKTNLTGIDAGVRLMKGHRLVGLDPAKQLAALKHLRPYMSAFGHDSNSTATILDGLWLEFERRNKLLALDPNLKADWYANSPEALLEHDLFPITILVDEYENALEYEPVNKRKGRDDPDNVEAEQINDEIDTLKRRLRKLAKVGRAAGLYIVVSTQFPDAKTMESLRGALPRRVQLSTPNTNSEANLFQLTLGVNFASKGVDLINLYDDGNMGIGVALNAETSELTALRTAYISDDELIELLDEKGIAHAPYWDIADTRGTGYKPDPGYIAGRIAIAPPWGSLSAEDVDTAMDRFDDFEPDPIVPDEPVSEEISARPVGVLVEEAPELDLKSDKPTTSALRAALHELGL